MKFKVEHGDSLVEGSIEDHLIGITKPSIDRMLRMENPGDAIALYTFYCYTRKWQHNNAVYATSDYAMTALGWGRDKFAKAKNQLKDAGFIEDIQRKDSTGKVVGWYVGVKFVQNHPADFPQGGSAIVWENPIQIPTTSIKIPTTNNKIHPLDEDFEKFWNAYPKKVSKEQARRSFYKVKPNIEVIIPVLEKFKACQQWQDKQYIPNPDTWVRNQRWEDEIIVEQVKSESNPIQSSDKKNPMWKQIKASGEEQECIEWLKENTTSSTYELRCVEERHLLEFRNRVFEF
jgi:hypothetical protein